MLTHEQQQYKSLYQTWLVTASMWAMTTVAWALVAFFNSDEPLVWIAILIILYSAYSCGSGLAQAVYWKRESTKGKQ